jgi:hypothetical protein
MPTTRARGGFRYIGSNATSIDLGAILTAAQNTATTLEVSGCRVTDAVKVTATTPTTGIIYDGHVSSAGTVTIRAINITAGTVNPSATEISVAVYRP